MTLPDTMPATESSPARRPCDTLRPTMYSVSCPGVTFRRRPLATNSARFCVPNMVRLLRRWGLRKRKRRTGGERIPIHVEHHGHEIVIAHERHEIHDAALTEQIH